MGGIGGMLGLAGGAGGSGFAAPQHADLVNPTNKAQINASFDTSQNALAQQQQLLDAIRAQNGIQNQSDVYGQLQGVVAGKGPNPAQAMLSQATGANVANQAALMAGQRGASQNVGLMARQAAQQGGALQQQAAGQAATMQANQSLNALNQAGGVAGQQVGNQIGVTNQYNQSAQNEQNMLLNAMHGYNQTAAGMQGNINQGNAALADRQMQGQQQIVGGIMQGGGAAMGMAEGGSVDDPSEELSVTPQQMQGSGPKSNFASFLKSSQAPSSAPPLQKGASGLTQGLLSALGGGKSSAPVMGNNAGGPEISATVAPAAALVAKGGAIHDYRAGGHVKAKNQKEKAVASGDSYANDKIPAVLSENEIVLPRSVTQSQDPVNAAARFVAAIQAKKRMKK